MTRVFPKFLIWNIAAAFTTFLRKRVNHSLSSWFLFAAFRQALALANPYSATQTAKRAVHSNSKCSFSSQNMTTSF